MSVIILVLMVMVSGMMLSRPRNHAFFMSCDGDDGDDGDVAGDGDGDDDGE